MSKMSKTSKLELVNSDSSSIDNDIFQSDAQGNNEEEEKESSDREQEHVPTIKRDKKRKEKKN